MGKRKKYEINKSLEGEFDSIGYALTQNLGPVYSTISGYSHYEVVKLVHDDTVLLEFNCDDICYLELEKKILKKLISNKLVIYNFKSEGNAVIIETTDNIHKLLYGWQGEDAELYEELLQEMEEEKILSESETNDLNNIVWSRNEELNPENMRERVNAAFTEELLDLHLINGAGVSTQDAKERLTSLKEKIDQISDKTLYNIL